MKYLNGTFWVGAYPANPSTPWCFERLDNGEKTFVKSFRMMPVPASSEQIPADGGLVRCRLLLKRAVIEIDEGTAIVLHAE